MVIATTPSPVMRSKLGGFRQGCESAFVEAGYTSECGRTTLLGAVIVGGNEISGPALFV